MHLHSKYEDGGCCGSGVFDVDGHTYIQTYIHTYIQTFFQPIGIASIVILHMTVWKLRNHKKCYRVLKMDVQLVVVNFIKD